ncbi:MAG: GIY-YIG nuclease family protein [Candidatus Obscuribacterales bacterium]|nr:GIY-YIG nuclease family protein [Candidatus Obscuribacterales bacterium]
MKGIKRAFTYIVRCSDDSLYTGWTVDLQHRIAEHNSGRGAKYTRGRGPVELMASWELDCRSDAMRLERMIKGMTRHEKQGLIKLQRSSSGILSEWLSRLDM